MYRKNRLNIPLFFFLISFVIVLTKLIIQGFIFNLPLDITTLITISDKLYLPLIDSFSNLNLNPSYSEKIDNLNIVSFPFLGLIINTLFYKFFGIYSFLILEIICLSLFLIIFYKIFLILNFSNLSALCLSLVVFITPIILKFATLLDLNFINLLSLNFETFYSLRFPRPIITNLFLFGFFLTILNFIKEQNNYKKTLIYSVILIFFSLHSFFYFFLFEIILLMIIYIKVFKLNVFRFISENFKFHFLLFFILVIGVIIFQFQQIFSEPDYASRIGLTNLDIYQKKILIKYFINFFTKTEFLILFSINLIIYICIKNDLVNIFYYFFISTIVSTILFIALFNRGIDYYHFANWIIASGFFYFIICIFYFLEKTFFKNSKIKSNISIIFSVFLSIFIVVSLNFEYYSKIKNNFSKIKDLSSLAVFFNQNEKYILKDYEILNLNQDIAYWLIINNYKNFTIVPNSFWSPKKTSDIENELISLFKFFNLNSSDFIEFFSNKISGYRIKNTNTERFFDRVYLANQLKVFDSNRLYTEIEKNFIKKNSPLITHQLIIPLNEFERLKKKFVEYDKIINPSIILTENNNTYFATKKIDERFYCLIFENLNYSLFIRRNLIDTCK